MQPRNATASELFGVFFLLALLKGLGRSCGKLGGERGLASRRSKAQSPGLCGVFVKGHTDSTGRFVSVSAGRKAAGSCGPACSRGDKRSRELPREGKGQVTVATSLGSRSGKSPPSPAGRTAAHSAASPPGFPEKAGLRLAVLCPKRTPKQFFCRAPLQTVPCRDAHVGDRLRRFFVPFPFLSLPLSCLDLPSSSLYS